MVKVIQFDVKDLLPIGMTLVVAGIGVAYGLSVLSDVKDDFGTEDCAARTDGFTNYNETSDLCYNSTGSTVEVGTSDFNATTESITGVGKMPEKLPLIVTVIVAAVIIGILLRYLAAPFMS